MTALDSEATFITYVGNGVGSQFNSGMWVEAADELAVVRDTDGESTPLVLGQDYVVTRLSDFNGALVTLVDENGDPDPLASGDVLVIFRRPPLINKTDLLNTTTLFPVALTNALNFLTTQLQSLQHQINRTIRFDPGRPFEPGTMDVESSSLAGRFLMFNEEGNPVAAAPVNVPVSTYWIPILVTENEAEALDALGLTLRILPGGGATGQVLTKGSATDYDVDWEDIPLQPAPVEAATTDTYVLTLADANKYLRLTDGAGVAVELPPDSDVAFPVNTELHFEQAGAGQITFSAGSGATMNVASEFEPVTAEQYAVVTAKKVAADTWTLFGYLEKAV